MKNIWEHHYKFYDLFQNNFDRYRNTITFHFNNLKDCNQVIDTGAGSGNLTLELTRHKINVTAIDSNQYAIELLKEKCKKYEEYYNVDICSVEQLTVPSDIYDGASSMFVIPFVKNNIAYISEIHRVLRHGGIFSLSTWAPVANSFSHLKNELQTELHLKNILPKHQNEFEHILQSSKEHENTVLCGPNIESLKNILAQMGFSNIITYPKNPYGKYAYFITCRK